MKVFNLFLLLFVFNNASAKEEKGVVVKILPDKLILPLNCVAHANLQNEKFSVLYTCLNQFNQKYYFDFRINSGDVVSELNRSLNVIDVNQTEIGKYTAYEITVKDLHKNESKITSYCTRDICLDLFGNYDELIRESILKQLR
ncbi:MULTISPECIES: hypothetical protein [unclassified Pseudoalteromonas]|uniref:hypothetical protein n=1 Tax=unclassified Pseudoalteromonas TaxID=194690 RepID=UPI000C08679C|nr:MULTISPECIES: hypothetical protein [unclassified Pseudoalteromonas]MDP2635145.1 hypothetical protein [Pseudoalteromonas sp. 1_MG-2023]PHN91503.1 hypothetical protein CSC79_00210 [Pseudoalteromonas sp. 3D05]